MSAPLLTITSCGAVTFFSDFDILRPCSSSTNPWVSTTSNGALPREGVGDALVDLRVLEDFRRAVGLLAHEYRDRHAPGALARDHPVGAAFDHAGDAVLAGGRHPARRLDLAERDAAQGAVEA